MRTAAVLLSLCAIADALAPDVPRMGSTLSRRGAMATFASGFLGASSLLGGPSASMAGDLPGDGFVTSPSGLKVKVLRSGTAGDLITNGLKAGDYIRMDVKGYTGGFGKEGKLVDSTEKMGPIMIQLGTGNKKGSTGYPSPGTAVVDIFPVPVLPAYDEVAIGHTIGDKFLVEIPSSLGFGKAGGITGTGVAIAKDTTLFYEIRLRSRAFAGVMGREQETFLDDDQIAKVNAMLGIGQDTRAGVSLSR